MLQQTQVSSVVGYFKRFMQRFPDLHALATASLDEVLHVWTGLGYYARARNLHRSAQIVWAEHDGYFPSEYAQVLALPGIGPSTAGAILALSTGQRHTILDGNVKRVLARYATITGWPGSPAVLKQLWALAEKLTPNSRVAQYTQAIMDLGATVCTRSRPACEICPLTSACLAWLTQTVADFPTPKIAKALPVKQLIFLLLHNNEQQVLLEKRPPTGIWGGLWSLPEFASEDAALNWCLVNNLRIVRQRFGATQRHTFSHYHLDYTPVLIETNSPSDFVSEADRIAWHNVRQINHLGLASPIKHLLQQHFKGG
jgi:A/G-specific adenine glycosylase